MLRRNVSFTTTLLVTLLTGPSFYWSVSHPWHDQSAHLWGILATALLVWQIPYARKQHAFLTSLACGILAVLSFMTKSNIGLAYGITFFIVFLTSPQRRDTLRGYGAGIFLGLMLTLLLIRFPKEFIEESLAFAGVAGRFSSLFILANWFANYYWLILGIVAVNVLPYYKKHPELITLFMGISFVGIFSMITGAITQPANNFLWGVQMALAFIVMNKIKNLLSQSKIKFYELSLKILTGMTIFLTIIAVQYGYQLKTWTYFQKNPAGNYVIKTKPLEGWRAPRFQGEPLDQLVEYINKNIPPTEPLLNLTDMYIIYALTGRDSYRGIPFVFFQDQLPARGEQAEQVQQNILSHPPDWILVNLNSSPVLQNMKIQEEIQSKYLPVFQTGEYFLLQKINSKNLN